MARTGQVVPCTKLETDGHHLGKVLLFITVKVVKIVDNQLFVEYKKPQTRLVNEFKQLKIRLLVKCSN